MLSLNEPLIAPIVEMILFGDSKKAKENLCSVLNAFNMTVKEVMDYGTLVKK